MEFDLSALHFLRPLWLLLIIPGLLLPLIWRQRQDLTRRLSAVIAPHLLEHLLVRPQASRRWRPVHLLAALLVLGGLAAAGPTWQQDLPEFLDNRAPLILAVDLSPSMDASDVPPTRLQAVRHKLQDLLQRRAGSSMALLAYAGSAHMVLPITDDPALLESFLQALSTGLIESSGKDVLGSLQLAKRLLAKEQARGSLVLFTDGADSRQFPAIRKELSGADLQVLVVAVGARDAADFDAAALRELADVTDAPLASLTLNDDDLEWIEGHAQQHFQQVQGSDELRWKDAGYWLCWPLLGLALLAIRRNWRVHWLGAVWLLLCSAWPAQPAYAGALADAFFTADQQGRWAFEQGRYAQAAEHFQDVYWKGLAAYEAADYPAALLSFSRVETASGYFYQGNTFVRLMKFSQAIAAYQQALRLKAKFPEAAQNLALAKRLRDDWEAQQQVEASQEPPDQIEFDNHSGKGREVKQAEAPATDQLWLDNLNTSPAQFLRRKFQLQDAAKEAP